LLCCWSIIDLLELGLASRIRCRVLMLAVRLRQSPHQFALLLLLSVIFGNELAGAFGSWPTVRGAEYWNIAQSLADGHGFSANDSNRWYFYDFKKDDSEYATDVYHPTAIEEPIYPFLLGSLLRLLGDQGKFVMLVLQAFAHVVTCVLVYELGRIVFGRTTGLLAGTALAIWPPAASLATGYLGPAPIGGLLITASSLLLFWCLRRPSLARATVLGAFLGISTLTLSSTQLFIPLASVLVILMTGMLRWRSWIVAAAIGITACAVISPWTIRNWMVFGEFVPVRTGFGLILHQGTILNGTYLPGPHACTDTLGPMWNAKGPYDAVQLVRGDKAKEMAVYKRSYDCVEQNAPSGFADFNEVQRDKVYSSLALDFIRSAPLSFAAAGISKFLASVLGWSKAQAVVGVAAVLGTLASLRLPLARPLVLMTLAVVAPYALGIPWGYRYRYPIEPLVLVFASYLVVATAQGSFFLLRKAVRARLC
jgi:4-amino-4-deoxy-L-arabinose transferase-like glycosyltransferase